ncbi:MAG: P-II family nitrogen regulator [Oscillospiraceae bacterium]|nr:P-II family nitrogen regulator [Oscillospiraceae bacterium]MCI2035744.1 P-II family nitrogen regulator [Oscillospiraceae bacterium]
MKEIMALIRLNMIGPTKEALSKAGFPSFFCRKCLGRGKKGLDIDTLKLVIDNDMHMPVSPYGEALTESARLIPKRLVTLVVDDDNVKKAVDTIIGTNQTGNPGDGKIFVLPVTETFRVRTAESSRDSMI